MSCATSASMSDITVKITVSHRGDYNAATSGGLSSELCYTGIYSDIPGAGTKSLSADGAVLLKQTARPVMIGAHIFICNHVDTYSIQMIRSSLCHWESLILLALDAMYLRGCTPMIYHRLPTTYERYG